MAASTLTRVPRQRDRSEHTPSPATASRVVIEDLDAAADGDGTALCLTLCWSGPAEGSTR